MKMLGTEMAGLEIYHREGILYLSGSIDEHADLSKISAYRPPLKLNFSKIKKINSVGIGKWINFIKDLGDVEIEYHECTEVLVEAANILPKLLRLNEKTKKIKSYQVPFFCAKCDKPTPVFCNDFEVEINKKQVKVPRKICPDCGSVMELDVGDDYFDFLVES